jgi:dTDP-D-glucose 4,6-dehydratase
MGQRQAISIISAAGNRRTLISSKAFLQKLRRRGMEKKELLRLITFVKDRPGHDRRSAIDPTKIETRLGWKHETDFDKGLSETVDWYLANRTWWDRIISGEYLKYYSSQYGEGFGE